MERAVEKLCFVGKASSQDVVDDVHGQPLPEAAFDHAVPTELRPHEAGVEGVGGDAAAEEPLAELLGEQDVGQLKLGDF